MNQRDHLRSRVLQHLFQGHTTRPLLLAALETRPATLFGIIDELKQKGLVTEPERKGKKTGRRASILELDRTYGDFLGIEVQPDTVFGIRLDVTGSRVTECQLPVRKSDGASGIKATVRDVFGQLRSAGETEIRGLGFADPGIVDIGGKRSIVAVNVEGWRSVPIGAWLQEESGIDQVEVYSATMARTYMEYVAFPKRVPESLFHIELGLGVGGGFIKNGILFPGSSHCAMEIGHLVVEPDGPLCQCGNRGCLEAIAGLHGIRRRVEQLSEHGVRTRLAEVPFSLSAFVACACEGDKAAKTLADEIAGKVAMALQAVVALLNPAAIVISGELTGLGTILLEPIRRYLELHCLPAAVNGMDLRLSSLDSYGTAQGVALLARDRALVPNPVLLLHDSFR